MKDPCGNGTCSDMTGSTHTTTYSYANSYTMLSGSSNVSYTPSSNTNAYLTQITNPLGQMEKFTYDYNSGELTVSQDQNDINASRPGTTYIYNDPLARPKQVNYPDGGSKSFAYNDTPYSPPYTPPTIPTPNVTTTTALASGSSPINMVTVEAYDGLGHKIEGVLSSDPATPDYTNTTYDGLGRVSQVTNPHRATASATDGTTIYTYDALSRTIQVTEPDGSIVSTAYDQTNTASTGVCATVTDEASKARQSCVDGLGRMTGVFEDPLGLKYETDYSYDPLNNLMYVNQKGNGTARTRSFAYDSLSRLTSAANPESGTIQYAYKYLNSNLTSKIAPSPNQPSTGTAKVTAAYTYDVLNRITGKSYSDAYAPNPATPVVTYGYDGVNLTCPTPIAYVGTSGSNVIGRRSAMCDSSGNKSWIYDPMGRLYAENDRFIGLVAPYNSSIVFNVNGVETISANTSYGYYLNGDLQGDSSPAW